MTVILSEQEAWAVIDKARDESGYVHIAVLDLVTSHKELRAESKRRVELLEVLWDKTPITVEATLPDGIAGAIMYELEHK